MNIHAVSCHIRDLWRSSKTGAFLIAACVILGIILGCIAGVRINSVIDSDNYTDYTVGWYLGNHTSFGGFLSTGFLDFIVFGSLILVCNCWIYLLVGNYLILIFKGYSIGYNILIIVNAFGIGGVVEIVFIFLPQQLLLLGCILYLSVISNNRCLEFRRMGFCFKGVDYPGLLRLYLGCFFVYFLLLLFFSVIASVFVSGMIL